jgi:hypothetical protein
MNNSDLSDSKSNFVIKSISTNNNLVRGKQRISLVTMRRVILLKELKIRPINSSDRHSMNGKMRFFGKK